MHYNQLPVIGESNMNEPFQFHICFVTMSEQNKTKKQNLFYENADGEARLLTTKYFFSLELLQFKEVHMCKCVFVSFLL